MNDAEPPQQFPEVYEAIWERDQIVALFTDLHQGATVYQVKVRTKSAFASESTDSTTLAEAYDLLRLDRVHAIQIDYEYDGHRWCDTVLATEGQFRILRTKN